MSLWEAVSFILDWVAPSIPTQPSDLLTQGGKTCNRISLFLFFPEDRALNRAIIVTRWSLFLPLQWAVCKYPSSLGTPILSLNFLAEETKNSLITSVCPSPFCWVVKMLGNYTISLDDFNTCAYHYREFLRSPYEPASDQCEWTRELKQPT